MSTAPSNASKVSPGDMATLEGLLEELPEKFIQCRDLRHAWSVDNDFYVWDNPSEVRALTIARDLVCLRCGTVRRQRFVQRRWGLERLGNNYSYQDGYQVHGVPEGLKPAQAVSIVQYKKAMRKVAKLARTQDIEKS